MTSKSQNIIDTLDQIFANLKRKLIIVECGTIRRTEPGFEEGDGHSTRYVAEWVKEYGGLFYSVDLNIKTAYDFLTEINLKDKVILSADKSTDFLNDFDKPIDFCYLDTADDPDNCLNEFIIAWPKITKGGALMADDCKLDDPELVKGDKLIPYLTENNIPFEYMENKVFGKSQIRIWK